MKNKLIFLFSIILLACSSTIPPLVTPEPTIAPTRTKEVLQTVSPTFIPTATKESACLVVIASESLYLRQAPTMDSAAITWMSVGTKIKLILKDDSGWWFVNTDGMYGYVKSDYVEECQK